jgi:hypothetical protein
MLKKVCKMLKDINSIKYPFVLSKMNFGIEQDIVEKLIKIKYSTSNIKYI